MRGVSITMRHLVAALLVLNSACYWYDNVPLHFPVPDRLAIFTGEPSLNMVVGESRLLPVLLFDTVGLTMAMPPGLTLLARTPGVIRVDSATRISALPPGGASTWVVASLSIEGQAFADSILVMVAPQTAR
jgi:hypothetical protein